MPEDSRRSCADANPQGPAPPRRRRHSRVWVVRRSRRCSRRHALDERAQYVDRPLPVDLVEDLVAAARVLVRGEVGAAQALDRGAHERDGDQGVFGAVDPEERKVGKGRPAVDGFLRVPQRGDGRPFPGPVPDDDQARRPAVLPDANADAPLAAVELELHGASRRLRLEPLHYLGERPLRHHTHLLVGPVLDWVRHVDRGRREAESLRLSLGTVDELLGRDEDRRHAARLEIDDVVHTARRARPSIGERFDDGVAARGDLVAQVGGRRLGEGRLAEAEGGDAASAQEFLETVEEHVAARLRDVEQADGLAGERGWPGDALADCELPLAGRIEENPLVALAVHGLISFITGSLPSAPLAQPPIIIEKSPARPPQWTRRSPFGRNFGSVALARLSGTPSAMPPAPRTSS